MEIIKNLVTSSARLYGHGNRKRTITIHETANTSKGANAAAHGRLQKNGNARSASWHYTVDDTQVVQSFPHTAQCWHAGDGRGPGNMDSIAIEICVNSDGNYDAALKNAAALTRQIMKDEGIPLSSVVQHNHWSGKNCPTQLRKGNRWQQFLDAVANAETATKPKPGTRPKPTPKPSSKSVATLAQEVIDGKHGNGADRRRSLGSRYTEVQAEVNRRLTGSKKKPAGKTINQMATEVIRGDHGNGHANRRRSLGIDAATYAKVRAEVNRHF